MHTNIILLFITLCLSARTGALVIPRATPNDVVSGEQHSRSAFTGRPYTTARTSVIEMVPGIVSKRREISEVDAIVDTVNKTVELEVSDDLGERFVRSKGGSKRSGNLETRIVRTKGGSGKRSDHLETRVVRQKGGSKRSDDSEK